MSKRDRCIDPERRHIHRAMRRGIRQPKYVRLEQSRRAKIGLTPAVQGAINKALEEVQRLHMAASMPKPPAPKKRDFLKPLKGFTKRLFNRKTGGS